MILDSIHSTRGKSMYGSSECTHASSVDMSKKRKDKYLAREDYT